MTFGNDLKGDRTGRTSDFPISVSWLPFKTNLGTSEVVSAKCCLSICAICGVRRGGQRP